MIQLAASVKTSVGSSPYALRLKAFFMPAMVSAKSTCCEAMMSRFRGRPAADEGRAAWREEKADGEHRIRQHENLAEQVYSWERLIGRLAHRMRRHRDRPRTAGFEACVTRQKRVGGGANWPTTRRTGRSAEALGKAALLWLCPLFFPSFYCRRSQSDMGQ